MESNHAEQLKIARAKSQKPTSKKQGKNKPAFKQMNHAERYEAVKKVQADNPNISQNKIALHFGVSPHLIKPHMNGIKVIDI